MRELVYLACICAGLLLGYFIGYRDGAEAREEEREALVEPSMMPSLPMTPEAFLSFDDMREGELLLPTPRGVGRYREEGRD